MTKFKEESINLQLTPGDYIIPKGLSKLKIYKDFDLNNKIENEEPYLYKIEEIDFILSQIKKPLTILELDIAFFKSEVIKALFNIIPDCIEHLELGYETMGSILSKKMDTRKIFSLLPKGIKELKIGKALTYTNDEDTITEVFADFPNNVNKLTIDIWYLKNINSALLMQNLPWDIQIKAINTVWKGVSDDDILEVDSPLPDKLIASMDVQILHIHEQLSIYLLPDIAALILKFNTPVIEDFLKRREKAKHSLKQSATSNTSTTPSNKQPTNLQIWSMFNSSSSTSTVINDSHSSLARARSS